MSEFPSIGGPNLGEVDGISGTIDSMPSLVTGELDAEHGVVLKDWSAQDFANIYVRFRPHLISHAKNFVRDETQAEEVVQDAFLYLMTALPELDSELGVLRFLKWKTKMLCLDTIRSSQGELAKNLIPFPDDVPDQTYIIDTLERADDAAIIRLALAKLKPRHREALIATLYEERDSSAVARQMGLSENAFRQLLFRARASFKASLVGEAETAGKSVSEILSIAAKKAARDSGKHIFRAGVLLTALGFFVGASQVPLQDADPELVMATPVKPDVARDGGNFQGVDEKSFEADKSRPANPAVVLDEESSRLGANPAPKASNAEEGMSSIPVLAPERGGELELRNALDSTLASKLSFVLSSVEPISSGAAYLSSVDGDIKAFIAYDLSTESVIQHAHFVFEVDGHPVTAVPKASLSWVDRKETTLVEYASTDFLVGDFDGNFEFAAVEDGRFSRSGFTIRMVFDAGGELISTELEIDPRI